MLFLFVPVLEAAFVMLLMRDPVEPVYHGKKLSQWVAEYRIHRSVDEEAPHSKEPINLETFPRLLWQTLVFSRD